MKSALDHDTGLLLNNFSVLLLGKRMPLSDFPKHSRTSASKSQVTSMLTSIEVSSAGVEILWPVSVIWQYINP